MTTHLSAARVLAIHKAFIEGGSTVLSSDEILQLCEAWFRDADGSPRSMYDTILDKAYGNDTGRGEWARTNFDKRQATTPQKEQQK